MKGIIYTDEELAILNGVVFSEIVKTINQEPSTESASRLKNLQSIRNKQLNELWERRRITDKEIVIPTF